MASFALFDSSPDVPAPDTLMNGSSEGGLVGASFWSLSSFPSSSTASCVVVSPVSASVTMRSHWVSAGGTLTLARSGTSIGSPLGGRCPSSSSCGGSVSSSPFLCRPIHHWFVPRWLPVALPSGAVSREVVLLSLTISAYLAFHSKRRLMSS